MKRIAVPSRRKHDMTKVVGALSNEAPVQIYVGVGRDDEEEIFEIFIDMAKTGSDLRDILDSFAQAVSIGLQYGVPLDAYVRQLRASQSKLLNALADVLTQEPPPPFVPTENDA